MLQKQKGFSLVELMVVVAIMLIMGTVALPTLVKLLPAYTLKNTARELCSNMRKARSMALKQNRDVLMIFTPGDNSYKVDTITVKLAEGVVFGSGTAATPASNGPALQTDGIDFDSNQITFNGRGLTTSSNQYVYLTNNRSLTVAIGASAAGNIAMHQWSDGAWQP